MSSGKKTDVSKPKLCRWVIISEVHIFRWTVPYKIEFLLWINLLMYSSNLVANFILKIIIKAVQYVVVVLQDAVSTLSVRILWTSESLSSVLITTLTEGRHNVSIMKENAVTFKHCAHQQADGDGASGLLHIYCINSCSCVLQGTFEPLICWTSAITLIVNMLFNQSHVFFVFSRMFITGILSLNWS